MNFEEFLLESEIDSLKKELESSDSYLKAPNGKKSNLPEKQWLLVRTKSFKKWFGDWENDPSTASKVVDKNGEPMICYHNSTVSGIEIFNPFRKANSSGGYTDKLSDDEANTLDNIRQRFADGKRPPFRYDTGIWLTASKDAYNGYGSHQYALFVNIRNPRRGQHVSWKDAVADNKDVVWDGVIIGDFDEVIVGIPEQIKSINNSNFKKSSPNINESEL